MFHRFLVRTHPAWNRRNHRANWDVSSPRTRWMRRTALASQVESDSVFCKWRMSLEDIEIHHVLLDWSGERVGARERKPGENYKAGRQKKKLPLPVPVGWYFCSGCLAALLLKCIVGSDTQALGNCLFFAPSVLHGALLMQSADPGTLSDRRWCNNGHRNLNLHHIFLT